MATVLDAGCRLHDRIGNYRIDAELGPSGSGLLLQAHHLVLPRRAIIKVVHTAFASVKPFVVQTLREACILEAIAHPGVPVVYESGVLRDRRPWFAFEMVTGPTLDELLAPGALAVAEVAGLLRDLVDILEHAHRRGVIHRGLRPDRVVITADRRYPLCIPDWSEAIAHDATTHVPQAAPEGSRGYFAPELAQELALGTQVHLDDRVDMFALGVIAYRALTGNLPFDGEIGSHAPVLDLRRDAPPALAALIDSLLAFDRFDRPSASELRAEIDWMLGSISPLQRDVAPDGAPDGELAGVQGSAPEMVRVEQPRIRRPRWTPDIGYVEATDVDIQVIDDELGTT
jgi:eukaryotic-like serine/threonine-protein kinase